MSLADTITTLVEDNFTPEHGVQVGVIRKDDSTFDKDEGKWVAGAVTDYPVYFGADKFSDTLIASGTLVGELLVWVRANQIDFVPYIGSGSRKHLQVLFGDWETLDDVDVDEATAVGFINDIDRAARFGSTQIMWGFTVKA